MLWRMHPKRHAESCLLDCYFRSIVLACPKRAAKQQIRTRPHWTEMMVHTFLAFPASGSRAGTEHKTQDLLTQGFRKDVLPQEIV